jgi:hypothetical protein
MEREREEITTAFVEIAWPLFASMCVCVVIRNKFSIRMKKILPAPMNGEEVAERMRLLL